MKANNFRSVLKWIALVSVFGISAVVRAAPGDIDPTFAGTGKFRGGFGSGVNDEGNAMAVQSDGKYVVAGSSVNVAGKSEFAVARYNTDGSLDDSFDFDGKAFVIIYSTNYPSYATAVAIQADGKIVVAGYTDAYNEGDNFAVLRFNSDGSLDPSFNGDGRVRTDFNHTDDHANAIAIQTDGKIVVAGYTNDPSTGKPDFAVVRYNTNGSLDTSFGGDGKVSTDISRQDVGYAIAIQSDGKIIVAGYAINTTTDYTAFAVVRYNTNGTLDTSFDRDGKLITSINGNDVAYAVAIQGGAMSNKIVVAGRTINPGVDFAIARYNLDGSLDTSFDGDGKLITTISGLDDVATGIQIQYQGVNPSRIIVGGYSGGFQKDSRTDFAVAKYFLNGSLDTAFNGDGIAITPIGAGADVGNALAFQAGKVIVAGYSAPTDTFLTPADFALVRYNSNGSLDTTFGVGGKRVDDISEDRTANAKAAAIQTDGKIVVAGGRFNSSASTALDALGLIRFNTDGSFDASFGNNGKVTDSSIVGKAVVIQTDGKIVVAGADFSGGSSGNLAFIRYNANGTLDTLQATALGTGGDGSGNAAAIQTDGKIVVAGYAHVSSNDVDFAVVRYNTNGSLDTSFNGTGKVLTSFGTSFDVANAVAIQSDGRIVVTGLTSKDFAAARYNTNGTLDTSFGTGGKVTTPVGAGVGGDGRAVAIQPDGKIVLAGSSNNGSNYDFAIVRYNVNGALDASFGTGGKVTTAVGTSFDNCNAVKIQSNGKIVAAGSSIVGTNSHFAVVRYNTDGSLDNSFWDSPDSYGSGGKVILDESNGGNDTAYGIALDAQGRAVVVGDAGGVFGVVRLLGDAPLSPTYEGDVQLRPNGDGFVDSDDIQQIRLFAVGTGLPYQSNEFQRADCSPRSTMGDGFVDGEDVQQARRYAVGTDSNQLAGGPAARPAAAEFTSENKALDALFNASPLNGKSLDSLPSSRVIDRSIEKASAAPAAFRIDNQNTGAGQTLTVPIRVDTVGNEAGYTFSIAYDSTRLTNPQVAIGNGGGDVVFNANNPGQIGFSVTSFPGGTIAAGNNIILVNVTFTVAANAPAGTTPITFTDTPARRKASGTDPNTPLTQPSYTGGTITIGAPTAAFAVVSGRVRAPDGRGVRNATVTLTDASGSVRATRTTTLGYFLFANVEVGQTYVLTVSAKNYQFEPQVLSITEDLDGLSFTARSVDGKGREFAPKIKEFPEKFY